MEALEHYELDLVAAGLTQRTPWCKAVALTTPYARPGGAEHVLALPPGENAWLLHVEQFPHEHRSRPTALLKRPLPAAPLAAEHLGL